MVLHVDLQELSSSYSASFPLPPSRPFDWDLINIRRTFLLNSTTFIGGKKEHSLTQTALLPSLRPPTLPYQFHPEIDRYIHMCGNEYRFERFRGPIHCPIFRYFKTDTTLTVLFQGPLFPGVFSLVSWFFFASLFRCISIFGYFYYTCIVAISYSVWSTQHEIFAELTADFSIISMVIASTRVKNRANAMEAAYTQTLDAQFLHLLRIDRYNLINLSKPMIEGRVVS